MKKYPLLKFLEFDVAVVGPPGSGKTLFTCALAESLLNLPPNWERTDKSDKFLDQLDRLAKEGYVETTKLIEGGGPEGRERISISTLQDPPVTLHFYALAGENNQNNVEAMRMGANRGDGYNAKLAKKYDFFVLVINPFRLLDQDDHKNLIYSLTTVLQNRVEGALPLKLACEWLSGELFKIKSAGTSPRRLTEDETRDLTRIGLDAQNRQLDLADGNAQLNELGTALLGFVDKQSEPNRQAVDRGAVNNLLSQVIEKKHRQGKEETIVSCFSLLDIVELFEDEDRRRHKNEFTEKARDAYPVLKALHDPCYYPTWLKFAATGVTMVPELRDPGARNTDPLRQKLRRLTDERRIRYLRCCWVIHAGIAALATYLLFLFALKRENAEPWLFGVAVLHVVVSLLIGPFRRTFLLAMAPMLGWLVAFCLEPWRDGPYDWYYGLAAFQILVSALCAAYRDEHGTPMI